jgi:glucuronate isomerase
MKPFLGDDFLLDTEAAVRLYHGTAEALPIIDYHCHLNPADIAGDRRFADLADVWLGGDHYKWRAMRADGVDESLITGSAAPYDKFLAWSGTASRLAGHPLYHWTHLELRRYFGIEEALSPSTAKSIWDRANEALRSPRLSALGILADMKVEYVGTTDDPADSLDQHQAIRAAGKTKTLVRPSFRPDKSLNVDDAGFPAYAKRLSEAAGIPIKDFEGLKAALSSRMDHFASLGCKISDHALGTVPFEDDEKAADAALAAALRGERPDGRGTAAHKTRLLSFLSAQYARRGWIMQLHMACQRNLNAPMFARLGPDTGYDAALDEPLARPLGLLLGKFLSLGELPRIILYSLNSSDFHVLGTVMGCFQGGAPGKIQLGSAWWFCDHIDGMEQQMRVLASVGSLHRFIGMLTDSRSFLSYPRHEYFRRILCRIVGRWVDQGELPADRGLLEGLTRAVCRGNAAEQLGLDS